MLTLEVINQVDPEIQELVQALRLVALDTDWSCAGTDDTHMAIRPTIQIRTALYCHLDFFLQQKKDIEEIMASFHITEYWLSLTFTYGRLNTHGGEPTWLLQIPGRFDWLSLPIAFSKQYIDGDDDLVIAPPLSSGGPT